MIKHAADRASADLAGAGIEVVAAVPDSLLSPLCAAASARFGSRYIQATDEATAIAITAGSNLVGTRALAIMENSGLRRGCETLARFTIGHGLHTVLLLSDRGAFGEPNWWGVGHGLTTRAHCELYRIHSATVDQLCDFPDRLVAAFAALNTGQCTVALIASRVFCQELAEP